LRPRAKIAPCFTLDRITLYQTAAWNVLFPWGNFNGEESINMSVGIQRISDQIRLVMRDVVKSTRSVIVVRCLSCQHRGFIAEHDLVRFGLKAGAPIAQFVKRLRCRKCGSGSVLAKRSHSKNAVA
jgi:hypothetical protein